jgi:hypothetical protein
MPDLVNGGCTSHGNDKLIRINDGHEINKIAMTVDTVIQARMLRHDPSERIRSLFSLVVRITLPLQTKQKAWSTYGKREWMEGPANVGNDTLAYVWCQNLLGIVRTFIIVDVKVIYSNHPMVFNPL